MLKRLLIWMVLIALPLQGFAAATMLHCAPLHSAAEMTDCAHDRDEGATAATAGHHDAAHAMADDAGCHQGDGGKAGKCSACHACSANFISHIGVPADFFVPDGKAVLAPHRSDTLSSIILEGPQRPPRSSIA